MGGISVAVGDWVAKFSTFPLLTQWAVVILLVSGVLVHIFKFNQETVHDGPSIFTTAGIFFTFVGIAIGLINFNVRSVEASIPELLAGLQTAFIASVTGVLIALSIKLRYTFFGVPRQRTSAFSKTGATVDDLLNQMISVQRSISGDDESTLVSQIKLSRQDTNDRLDELRRSQTEFMEKMTENNSKALIGALQEVIQNFNQKISEQFGENFRHLNEAVGRLLTWQENYRTQLSDLISKQAQSVEAMGIATDRYFTIVTHSESFGKQASQLGHLLNGLETQRNQIEASLKLLAGLLETAASGLPQLEAKIIELTQQVTYGVRQNQDEMTKVIHESSVNLQTTITDLKKLILETTQTTNQEVNAHFTQLSEKTNEQIIKLDQAMERELNNALKSLGTQLASLSKKFVDDYAPLTDKLRDLVKIAGRA